MKRCIIIALLIALVASCATADVRKIVISAGGDVLLGGAEAKRTDVRFAQFVKKYGDGYVLGNLRGLFSSDDITIINLEGPLKRSASPRKPSKSFSVYGVPDYVRILTYASVEVANIVNNHIQDYNTKGATKKILAKNGIIRSDNTFNMGPNSMVVNDVRVGFIGFQTPCRYSDIKKMVKRVKSKCDICVVSFHFCTTGTLVWKVGSDRTKAAHAAVNAGADLVLGHHPHAVSGIERYKDKLIFYDLGSIVSSGKGFHWNNMVARITLAFDTETKVVTTEKPVIYPGYSSSAGVGVENNCQPILWNPGDAGYEEVFERIDAASAAKGIKQPAEYIRGVP